MSMMGSVAIRRAGPADAGALKPLIEGGYRGPSARRGWTHEADIIEEERIGARELAAMLDDRSVHFLVAEQGSQPVGCIAVTDKREARAYFGLLCVDPAMQSSGLGSRLIREAEELARSLGASIMEISVIEDRTELIAMYERKGYRDTGKREPFPAPQPRPLHFRLFEKRLRTYLLRDD